MKKTVLLVLVICGIAFYSCKPSKEKLSTKIKGIEQELLSDSTGTINKQKAEKMISLYKQFAEQFPDDSVSPLYLIKAAQISMNMNKNVESVELFALMMSKYPTNKLVPEALFLQGFVYDNNMKNFGKARDIYIEFLKKYPNHELAKNVQFSLDNLGKSPEQIIQEFQMKRTHDSLSTAKK